MESSHTLKHFQMSENTCEAFSVLKRNTPSTYRERRVNSKTQLSTELPQPIFIHKKSKIKCQTIVLIIQEFPQLLTLANVLNLPLGDDCLIIKSVLY